MRILVIPDSFKGSLTSERICEITRRVFAEWLPQAQVDTLPFADGGEGTLDCLIHALDCDMAEETVAGPLASPVTARIGFLQDRRTAVVEAAQAVGLTLVGKELCPLETNTYGLGQMLLAAERRGADKFLIALGGSCTSDCGAGMLSALGVEFFRKGKVFVPAGGTLNEVEEIRIKEAFQTFVKNKEFRVLCDVSNPLCGTDGAARVFAPQKGANAQEVERIERGMKSFSALVAKTLGHDCSMRAGAGAAGGLGYAFSAFLSGKLVSGVDEILTLYDFVKIQQDYDLILTGEGCFDSQSLMGKAVGGILARTKKPVVVLCGKYKPFDWSRYRHLKCVLEISGGQETQYAISHAEENLRACLIRFCQESL